MADGGAAVAEAIANAIRASGVLVRVTPQDFANILRRVEKPLIVYSEGGIFSASHQYLTSYKGFAFFTKAREQIDLPKGVELVIANKIWIPK